ncbi:MAG: hypothetical protein Q7S92_00385 [Candidatus Diapherotrites archaeon]|nr:hypothetical protein [Candidatus Diapherotrites archaeon]
MPGDRLIRRHERRPMGPGVSSQNMPSGMPSFEPTDRQKPEVVISLMKNDIRALNSAIAIISQKMKHLIRNEKILGRNLVVLNKKLQQGVYSKGPEGSSGSSSEDLQALTVQLEKQNQEIQSLSNLMAELRTSLASREEVLELRHVIDSINPLEFTTRDDVKELIALAFEKKKTIAKEK